MLSTLNHDNLLHEFIKRWPLAKLEVITLEEYVDTNNKDTFCYWVETRTIELGSIKGFPSKKFGIYKRSSNNKPPISGDFSYDEEYVWRTKFGEDRYTAFETVINLVLQTIQLALRKNFRQIDTIKALNNMFKWKLAFLYSQKSLLPIFSLQPLRWCAHEFDMPNYEKARISDVHHFLISRKPENIDCFQFADNLYTSYKLSVEENKLNDSEQGSKEAVTSGLEGKRKMVYTSVYERKTKLRNQAIAIHGTICCACGFDFRNVYGIWGEGYIQVHHVNPLFESKKEVIINPSKDLVVLCANCHAMVHRKKDKTLSIQQLKKLLKKPFQ